MQSREQMRDTPHAKPSKRSWKMVLAATLAIATTPTISAAVPLPSDEPRQVLIVEQQVEQALRDIARELGVILALAPSIEGTIRRITGTFTAAELLDTIGQDKDLAWYFDGRRLFVSAAKDSRTLLFELDRVSLETLEGALRSLDILDERFPLSPTEDGRLARLTAPPAYVDIVQATYDAFNDAARRQEEAAAAADAQARDGGSGGGRVGGRGTGANGAGANGNGRGANGTNGIPLRGTFCLGCKGNAGG